jgi:hypothetical protein
MFSEPMEVVGNAYKISDSKPEGKRPFQMEVY